MIFPREMLSRGERGLRQPLASASAHCALSKLKLSEDWAGARPESGHYDNVIQGTPRILIQDVWNVSAIVLKFQIADDQS